ncbi:hypothetical protein Taro_014630 [Colocasia esculenta]|uniref:Cytochrome P450 n=1 Tax=Colocasia esculenta TaxID=4460 RepID=A0A843UJY8_COLES|nr:hypothetical protein [Colocasia esculenta]
MALSLQSLVLQLAAAVLVLALGLLLRWRSGGGRRYHPVAGTLLQQLLHFRRLYHYQTDVSRRYRTFRMLSPFRCDIYTTDPAVVEHVLRTNFQNYGKGAYNYEIMTDLLGDGIFAVDGSKWRHQRKLASYEFSTRTLRDYSGAVFKKNATKLASAVGEASAVGLVMDVQVNPPPLSHKLVICCFPYFFLASEFPKKNILDYCRMVHDRKGKSRSPSRPVFSVVSQDWFMKSTMDSIFEVAFGIELNCLRGSSSEDAEFVRAFDESSALIMWRFLNPFWKLSRLLNLGSEATLKKNIKRVDDYVYKLILSKLAQMNSQQDDYCTHAKKEDILSRFLLESERDAEKMDLKYLRDIILNFLIAGKDTTAGTLSWFFFLLCKHPSVQAKIAQEVVGAVRDGETASSFKEFAANITEDALEKMQYLHAALSETLRLYPAVPLDPKVCFSDDTLPDGYDVRRGEVITFQPYAMGRMEYLWGEDAEVFRPERWLDADGLFCPQSPFKFTAFQAGPRLCLGREFAYRQMKTIAAVLLRFFVFELSDEKKAVNYKTMLTLHIDQGLQLHAFERRMTDSVVFL